MTHELTGLGFGGTLAHHLLLEVLRDARVAVICVSLIIIVVFVVYLCLHSSQFADVRLGCERTDIIRVTQTT